jgi:hypothetical protein
MTIAIDWHDLEVSKRLQDNDVVSVQYQDLGDANRFEVQLMLARHKTWWKGLQVLDNTEGQVDFLEVQDDNRDSGNHSITSDDVEVGGRLVLWKAKFAGVHTPMYHSRFRTLTW